MNQKWLLCDLHMHSQYSKINKIGDKGRVKDMSAGEFVDILNQSGVELFSITDHNYFSDVYYDEIDKYIMDNNLSMKIINGVELDAYVELKDETKDSINICIYFSDNTDRKKLNEVISSLYRDNNNNMLEPLFIEIVNKLSELNTKFIIIPHGDKHKGLFNMIKNLNDDDSVDFYKYSMYKIFNAFDVRPVFYGVSESFWATSFYEKTKSFDEILSKYDDDKLEDLKNNISNKIKNNAYELTEEELEIYKYILDYGSYFAYFTFSDFTFSDWHNKEDYNPEINNFVFGTLEYGFEAVELATLDPKSRIEQSHDKYIEIPSTILKKVEFKIKDDKKEVYFSPGLNAIVGKRGSGKSLLLSVIKNLVEKDADDGALSKYKKLEISDIVGQNRDNINISLGSLNSVAFLNQDQIKEIFENPENAQKNISKNFKEIKSLNLNDLINITDVASKLKPYNKNYKNLTSNIISIKKIDDYNLSTYEELDNINIKKYLSDSINSLKLAINELENLGLDGSNLKTEFFILHKHQKYYLKVIELYNTIINNNAVINDINSKKSANEITIKQNINTINSTVKELKDNFAIQLNYEKLKLLVNNFKFDNPPVEVTIRGKYLFVTYYDIPINIRDIILDKITDTITRSKEFEDIENYLVGDKNRQLKAGKKNISEELEKYIKSDTFKSKKEFYEIIDTTIDYKTKISSMNELEDYLKQNKIRNLTDASPGMKSVAYLDMLFDLDETILILDQPEDNIDNDYISKYLVPNIKGKKKIKQLIFVTHNPSVAVYGDSFNYVYVENNDKINYTNYLIEKKEDKDKLINILEGGKNSFSNRNKKFGNVLGDEEYGNY